MKKYDLKLLRTEKGSDVLTFLRTEDDGNKFTVKAKLSRIAQCGNYYHTKLFTAYTVGIGGK